MFIKNSDQLVLKCVEDGWGKSYTLMQKSYLSFSVSHISYYSVVLYGHCYKHYGYRFKRVLNMRVALFNPPLNS